MNKTMARKSKKAAIPESIVNDATKVFTDAPRGTRQGDLYLVSIPKMPLSAKPRNNLQLADGNTQGSRHVCTRGEVFDANAEELAKIIRLHHRMHVDPKYVGPVVRGPAYIEHPEHGDHDFQCEGIFAVIVQRSLDAEERERRVLD